MTKGISKLAHRSINTLRKWHIRFRMRPYLLHRAIRQADRLSKKNNSRRYRVFFFGDKYRVWDRWDIKEQKRIGLLKKDRKVGVDFDSICFYDTHRHVYQ